MGGLKPRWFGVAAGGVFAAVAVMTPMHRGAAAAAAPAASSPTPPAATPTRLSAKMLAGAWALPGLSCATPLTIVVSGSTLSLAVAGGITNYTIPPTRSDPNVLVVSGDGAQTFRLEPGGVLTITAPGGSPAVLTRCAG